MMSEAVQITGPQIFVLAVVLVMIGYGFGYLIARGSYKARYFNEISDLKRTVDTLKAEKSHLIKDRQHDISKAVTNEWNRGYSAAWEKLKILYLYIQRWEIEHGITPGELETLADQFTDKKEEEN